MNEEKSWDEKLGGRKFILVIGILFATIALLWFDKIDKDIYKYVVSAIMMIYVAGNVGQKWITKVTTANGTQEIAFGDTTKG